MQEFTEWRKWTVRADWQVTCNVGWHVCMKWLSLTAHGNDWVKWFNYRVSPYIYIYFSVIIYL